MTDLSDAVGGAIGTLVQFYRDVSKLFVCVEDELKEHDLVSLLPDATSMWDRSSSYRNPERWMARYVARLYIDVEAKRQAGGMHQLVAFFAVFFTPKALKEPIAFWGVARSPEPADLLSRLRPVLLRDGGPSLLLAESTTAWVLAPGKDLDLTYRTVYLIELRDADTVRSVVIQPLLAELKKHRVS